MIEAGSRLIGSVLLLIAAAVGSQSPPTAQAPWGDQGDGTYRNPVLPADFSDIDCIRVGADYYAISSTFQFSPGMVVLHSHDLVNWRILGHAVPDVTQIGPEMNWDRMDRYGRGIWAGAIRHHAGKFWLYFGTPDEGYFVTTATNPAGPWEPLTCVMRAPGWDDCCPFWDDDGQGYLVGTSFKDNYKIHLFKLTPDGKALVPGFDHVIHQAQGREASKLYKWNGLYYHFFSEVNREGRVPMMGRAKNITGPYERRQLSHVNPRVDREPNQGGIVQTEKGDWWFVTHQGTGAYEGRTMCLLPVTWRDGWPIIGEIGADGIGNMMWQAKKPIAGLPVDVPQTSDEFNEPTLGAQWEWNYQPRRDKWSLTERPSWLRLHAFRPLQRGNLLKAGNTLTQRLMGAGAGEATMKLDVSHMADGQAAGLCHFGKGYGWIGVTQTNNVRRICYSASGKETTGPETSTEEVWLRSVHSLDGDCTWAFSLDGTNFTAFGGRYKFEWANYRGDRLGIFSYNNDADAGQVDCDWLHYSFNSPASHARSATASARTDDDVLLFTYFRNNGRDGVHLATSANGLNFVALNDDKAIFTPPPWPGQNLTRDASVLFHDGKFRMVWTSGWKGRIFGCAESEDLVHWSEPRQVKPFPESLPAEDQPDNIWAPEIHWDPLKQDYFILFASTTPRERNDDDDSNNNGKRGSQYDNRIFITRTKDFRAFTPAQKFFDRGFASIDAVMRRDEANQRWVMVIKCSRDETLKTMPGRNLWLTFTGLDLDHADFSPLEGPIAGNHSPMFSNPEPRKSMAEGPALLHWQGCWLLAWDEPAGGGMQLATSADLKAWTHLKQARFPPHAQHGTLFLAPKSAVGWLTQTFPKP